MARMNEYQSRGSGAERCILLGTGRTSTTGRALRVLSTGSKQLVYSLSLASEELL
jgi:hypothetical protein